MARLELQQLCKGFDRPVLDRISFSVAEGEFFVVVGPSGIGKTTLLRCIAGLEAADAGRVLIGGKDVTAIPPYRRNVAMTFESYALYPHLTVFENIASPLRAKRMPEAQVKAAVHQAAKLLRIDQLLDRKPHQVSGGQKQRTALGRTLVAKPDVFLLDEPISHLDAKIRHELRRQFHTLEELRRVATVYVTHDYAEALALGDRIAVMGPGGLEQVGSARDVFLRPHTLFVARHLGQPSINEVRGRIASRDGRMVFSALHGSLTAPVAAEHAPALSRHAASEIVVGIRPQHTRVATGSTDGFALDAHVEIFEPLGSIGVLIAEAGEISLTALTSPDERFAHGARIKLGLDASQFLYFDAASGRNLLL
jgi:multiple sugar transport system ATP-binding protein